MTFLEIVIIAIGLGMDAAAVSLAAASAGYAGTLRAKFRLAFHFGLFQFLMPVIGWWMGIGLVAYLKSVDHWVAFGLLAFVGGRMIVEGFSRNDSKEKKDPSRGMTMVMLSIATSIDALAIGLSLAVLDINIWYPAIVIGITACLMSVAAIYTGIRLGTLFGKRMEIVGGVILIGIGLKILMSHLFGIS